MTTVHASLAGVSSWLWPMMLHHLWQAACLSGVAWFLCLLAKRASAKTRYWIWLLASFKCALPAVFLVWIASSLNIRVPWPANAVSRSSTRATSEFPFTNQSVAPALGVSKRSPNAIRTAGDHAELYCALTLVWGAGTVFCLAVFSKRRLALKSALRRGKLLISGRAVDALRRMKDQLKKQRPVTLLISSSLSEPGICGIWKPILVLPQGMVEALTDQELEAVMVHELVHVQRRDNLVSLFQSCLSGVFWFYPVVWLIDRQLLMERELACDEEVLASAINSENYLSSLMKVFRLSLGGAMAGVSLATGSNLKRRIDHMRSHHSRKNNVVLHRLMITGFALALTVSIVGAALLNQGLLVAHENSEPSKVTNSRRSVSAPRGVATAAPGIGLGNISSGTSGNLSGEARFVVSTKISGNVNQAAQEPVHVAAHRTPMGRAQQAGSAKLAGTVYDASKAAVPDATVVVSSAESKTQEITISGAAGEYEFRVLPVGHYWIEARKSGFRVFKQQALLTGNESGRLDIVLDVGEVSERVEVVAKAPPAASPNTGPSPPRRIRVGGNVQATRLVHTIRPVYPERAQAQGIQGVVLLEAVILMDGNLGTIRVVNKLADPDLVNAAVEAVKSWRYEPTLLNGQPVEVLTTITVNFRLSSSY